MDENSLLLEAAQVGYMIELVRNADGTPKQDENGNPYINILYPKTVISAIFDANGLTVEERLELAENLASGAGAAAGIAQQDAQSALALAQQAYDTAALANQQSNDNAAAIEDILAGGTVDAEQIDAIQDALNELRGEVTDIQFILVMNGLVDDSEYAHVAIDIIDSAGAVNLISGQYAGGKVFI
jgi:hypothetical protein